MKADMTKSLLFLMVLLPVLWVLSCSGNTGRKIKDSEPVTAVSSRAEEIKIIKMVSPEENSGFRLHEAIKILLRTETGEKNPDSVKIFFDGKSIATIKSEPWVYSMPGQFTLTTGRKSLKVTPFRDGKQHNSITRFLVIYSDMVPEKYGYKVVHTYPHDRDAFTQGLVYDKGKLYEGTGQKTGSCLREVELETGRVLRQHNLDPSLFGEGITIYRDKLYEVTWQDKVGFVYDKGTFSVINKIYYPTEGWGLTTVDDRIAMSDGTNMISYYEPEMFTSISGIEVYDNEHKVDKLNELEYINGEIWANVWMTDMIARIDPASGKVLAYVDMKGLLPASERTADTDVLNGIAYDKDGDRIFVTGKKWPFLYEIKLVR